MASPFPNHKSSSNSLYDAFEETQEALDTLTSSHTNRTQRVVNVESPTLHHQVQPRPRKLQFLQLAEWDENNGYDEEVPTCLHYSIEWKVSVNSKVISKDTEQDLVLEPITYWHMVLKPKLDKLLRKKVAQNRLIRCDDTTVVASVTDHSERDLTKRFDDVDINWSVIQKQLIGWGELFRRGKKLRVDLSFNYIDSADTTKRGFKRGSSATQLMLADRTAQLDAEEESSGQSSTWREVYALMQCPGSPCDLGPHCWRDPFRKKHYKLRTHHLKALIEFVEQGNTLRSHDDVPEHVREQLFAEEWQRLERQPNLPVSAPTPFPPINITNVLPASHQSSIASSVDSSTSLKAHPANIISLDIPGPRDVAVRLYSEWQQSNVADERLKTEFQKACDVSLDDGLDLEQVYEDQDPEFFIQSGVKRGVARRFVRDIAGWSKRYKQSHSMEVLE
jgi:hypothetical protein